nr:hypothetical protein [uncultured Flavobacterium sp.]
MKKRILFFVIILFGPWYTPLFSQNNNDEPEALGLPGDNLNLYAVLDVFQKSKTLEDFERSINDKETNINNLDLDNDRDTDYIKVVSYKEGKSHSIVLQVAINSKENQDVAVIGVNTNSSGKVRVQIIGDEDLYGENYIVEPSSDTVSETPNPGYTGSGTVIVNNTTNNNTTTSGSNGLYVANNWPVIVYLFSPVYVIYRSPWHWGYYPSYWHPWAPIYYYNYWGYHNHYYRNHYYRRTNHILYPSYYSHYSSRRNSSIIVRKNRRNGNYNATYNGRDYKRPVAPTRPTTRPGTRPTTPTTRPVRPTTPANRPVTRPTTPTTRPMRPTTRPTAPNTGSNRQATSSTRRN